MKLMNIRGVEIILRPISMLFFGCAFFFFEQKQLIMSFFSLLIHEISHVIIAKFLGVGVDSLEVMPYGGMANLDESFTLIPLKELFISLAGPIANLWLITNTLAVNELFPQAAEPLRTFIRSNMYIAAFNLLPALPLDGGRIIRAALSLIMKPAAATRIAAFLGMAFGILIAALGVISYKFGKINLTLILTGLGILFGAIREFRAAKLINIKKLTSKRQKLKGINEVRHIAVSENAGASNTLAALSYGKLYEIFILDENENVLGTVTGAALKKAVLSGASTMAQVLAK